MNKIIEHAANILVVDDHPIVRKGIAALLCHTASYITEASCAAEAADTTTDRVLGMNGEIKRSQTNGMYKVEIKLNS